MSESLQTLEHEWLQLEQLLSNNEGVLTDEQAADFDAICQALAQKHDSYLYVRQNIKSQIEQGKFWIDKFTRKVRSLENNQKYLESKLQEHMEATGQTAIDCELGKIRMQESKSANIVDSDSIPALYKKIVQETKIDKKQILADLKAGKDVPGAKLEVSKFIRVY